MLKMIQSVLSIILNRPGTFSAKNGIITQRTSPRRNFSTSCWVWFSNATVSNFSISCWLYAFRGLKGYLPFWSRVFPLTVHSQIYFIEGQLDINIARILIFLYSWIFLNLKKIFLNTFWGSEILVIGIPNILGFKTLTWHCYHSDPIFQNTIGKVWVVQNSAHTASQWANWSQKFKDCF